jgi:hypothetical protein
MKDRFGIGTAIAVLRHGGKVKRDGWAGGFLFLDGGAIIWRTGSGVETIWTARSVDLLADDYLEVT